MFPVCSFINIFKAIYATDIRYTNQMYFMSKFFMSTFYNIHSVQIIHAPLIKLHLNNGVFVIMV